MTIGLRIESDPASRADWRASGCGDGGQLVGKVNCGNLSFISLSLFLSFSARSSGLDFVGNNASLSTALQCRASFAIVVRYRTVVSPEPLMG